MAVRKIAVLNAFGLVGIALIVLFGLYLNIRAGETREQRTALSGCSSGVRAPAFQAGNAGSNPATRSNKSSGEQR